MASGLVPLDAVGSASPPRPPGPGENTPVELRSRQRGRKLATRGYVVLRELRLLRFPSSLSSGDSPQRIDDLQAREILFVAGDNDAVIHLGDRRDDRIEGVPRPPGSVPVPSVSLRQAAPSARAESQRRSARR